MSALRYRYQTYEFGELDIHLRTLRDTHQFSDPKGLAGNLGIHEDTWPLFGVVLTTPEILAQLMMDVDIENRRILEVGCGIGLASHVLNHRQANISATDFHPEAEAFMEVNVELNQGRPIPFFQVAWSDKDVDLGGYDLIIGSDVLYEPRQASCLTDFIGRAANQACEVLIVDADRGVAQKFSDAMQINGFQHEASTPELVDQLDLPFTGTIHRYYR
ncbi:MAG TPA: histidine kinase [Gammaproteobacteria bacterium]|nr:histidine kinase [Gammaproteobacteria bacterium]